MYYEKRSIARKTEQDHQSPAVSKTSKQSEEHKTSTSQRRGESKNILTFLVKERKIDEELYFSMIPRGIRINAEQILTQSTASTFEYFHTTSPNILDTGVPLSL